MGKKWLCFPKISSEKERTGSNDRKTDEKPKKRWFGRLNSKDSVSSERETASFVVPHPPAPSPPAPPQPIPPPSPPPPTAELPSSSAAAPFKVKVKSRKEEEDEEEEQSRHQALAIASAVVAEAAVVAARAAAEVIRLTSAASAVDKSREEVAAIKIQTAYRGYVARRALRVMRGLSRLKELIQGDYVKRQASGMLRSLRTMTTVRSQMQDRKIRMSEENKARHRLLNQNQQQKIPGSPKTDPILDDFDSSTKTKDQINASLLYKKEAAGRRERALAYAYSHQRTWRTTTKLPHQTLMDPSNPHWGWSWLERWMAIRPWEKAQTKIHNNNSGSSNEGRKSVKTSPSREFVRPSPVPPKPSMRSKIQKPVKSVGSKRETGLASSVKDNESVGSSSTVKSHLGNKKPANSGAGSTGPSHLGLKKAGNDVSENKPVPSARRRLPFSGPVPVTRRVRDPVKETDVPTEAKKGKSAVTR